MGEQRNIFYLFFIGLNFLVGGGGQFSTINRIESWMMVLNVGINSPKTIYESAKNFSAFSEEKKNSNV